ncbi:MAG: hypothetical protein CMJ18_10895 [Phycisphaeraceae bacterium]|nr:hypothetical protein [Phycisphaeraceae bacterium]
MSRIEHIRATEVVVHAKDGYVDRPGFGPSIFDKGPKWLIEIRTDDGLVGCGETPRNVGRAAVEAAARQVLGKPLRDIPWAQPIPPDWSTHDALGHVNPPVPHRFYEVEVHTPGAEMGVMIAVQDLIARSADMRLVDLFGGAEREAVPVDWWVGRTDPAHITEQMQIGLRLGYRSIKMKAAAEDDIPGIVSAYKMIAGVSARMVIDPNQRFYRCSEAVRIARRVEQHDNIIFEDPFPFDPDEWRQFRASTTVPICMHCGTRPHVAMAAHCCDYVNLCYPAARFLGDAYIASQFGMLCWSSSGVELGVLDAYILHYSAAARTCVLPGDAFGHDLRENDLINETLQAVDGHIDLPSGPGLGVTIDEDALSHYRKDAFELK